MIATTSKSDKKMDNTEPGLVMDWVDWAKAEGQNNRGSSAQPPDKYEDLPKLFDSLNLTDNIGESDTKFVVDYNYLTMSNQRAIYKYV